MARNTRQMKILELIAKKAIETQDELTRELELAGFKVTQATVSRDIKELGLVKVTENAKQRYVRDANSDKNFLSNLTNLYKNAVLSIEQAQNIVVIKTIPSGASAVGMAIDRLSEEHIMGCIAGDDTVFVVTKNNETATETVAQLSEMLD